jgi:hypothetical protein
MTAGPIQCAYCGKTFVNEVGRWTHTKSKHHGCKNPYPESMRVKQAANDDESLADRAVQAEIDRACGIDNPDIDWLLL